MGSEGGRGEGGRDRSLAPITRDICSIIAHEISRNFEIVIPKAPNPARQGEGKHVFIFSTFPGHLTCSPLNVHAAVGKLYLGSNQSQIYPHS